MKVAGPGAGWGFECTVEEALVNEVGAQKLGRDAGGQVGEDDHRQHDFEIDRQRRPQAEKLGVNDFGNRTDNDNRVRENEVLVGPAAPRLGHRHGPGRQQEDAHGMPNRGFPF